MSNVTRLELAEAVFKRRGLLMALPMTVCLVCFWREWENDIGIAVVGLPLFGMGVSVRCWAQAHLRYRLGGPARLVTDGPYHWVRNPIYLGNTAILVAVTVLSELFWLVPFVTPYAIVVYRWCVVFESSRLEQRYGNAYRAYVQIVGAWWPRVPMSVGADHVGRKPVLRGELWRAEYHTLLLLLIPLTKEFVLVPVFEAC